jgi:hypothetical protein
MYPAHIYDEDFEPSLNFTLRFVMLISYVSVETFVLITEPCMIICVCCPNQNWSSFVVDVFPFIGWDFYRTWPWTTQRVCNFRLTLDFEPSLNFTKVCHVNFICFSCNLPTWNFVLVTEPCMIICHRSFIIPPLHWKGGGGILFYLCPSVLPKMFITFFLSNYLWQQSDIPPPFPVERGYNKAPMTYDHAWFCY